MPGYNRYHADIPEIEELKISKPSSARLFCLLMWKNCLQQLRHKIQTIMEILLPPLTLILILILRYKIPPIVNDTEHYYAIDLRTYTHEDYEHIIKAFDLANLAVAYSPENAILRDIVQGSMQDFMSLFGLSYVPYQIEAYKDSAGLAKVYKTEERTRQVLVAIEFPDELADVNELPNDMKFSLRFPERPRLYSFYGTGSMSWHTMDIFPVFQPPGPRLPWSNHGGNEPDYFSEYFLSLQYFVACEIIAKITGENTIKKFQVMFKRWPNHPFIADYGLESMKLLLPMLITLSYSYSAVNIVRALVVEKESQIKEHMKIMGMTSRIHWCAWFCKQIIFLTLSAILVVVVLKVKWFTNKKNMKYSVLQFTPWTVLFFYMMLYMVAIICFCFMLSNFFQHGRTASLFTGIIWFFTFIPSIPFSVSASIPIWMQVISSILINTLFAQGLQILINAEGIGGMKWGSFLHNPEVKVKRLLFGHIVGLFIITSILYLLLTVYIEKVNPGSYGRTGKWYYPFVCKKQIEKKKRQKSKALRQSILHSITAISSGATISQLEQDSAVREGDLVDHKVGAKVVHLSKTFGKHRAVNNLSLDVYYDQITMLLGHNGAGKSTTMAMLTGALKPTSGSISVAGYDMRKEHDLARSHIGYCPQNNVIFKELTVKEHLQFYSRLKGFTGKAIEKEITSMIAKLELQSKTNSMAETLSGGQKRRLQVGIALCGQTRVVLLDEPTSGMDPASRRALWDLLQSEKKGRCMILSTHFLDEADVLGDRIAIMSHGQLNCVGTPYFLKKHYGSGYILTVVKDQGFQPQLCTDIIHKYIPGCSVYEDKVSEVSYRIESEHSNLFEKLLTDLEANIDKIKYLNYGLSASTLEDVFMNIGSDLTSRSPNKIKHNVHQLDVSLKDVNQEKNRVKGLKLLWQQIYSIFFKLWLVWKRSWAMILLQMLVPVLILASTLVLVRFVTSMVEVVTKRELSLADGYDNTESLVSFEGKEEGSLGAKASNAYTKLHEEANLKITPTPTRIWISDFYLKRTKDPDTAGKLRYSLLNGASYADTRAIAWFTAYSYHDIAISLATILNSLLKAQKPDANLKIYNHPLKAVYKDQGDMTSTKEIISVFVTFSTGITLAIISAVFIMFYIKEKQCKAKLLQKATGIKPVTMWLTTFVFDWFWFHIICIPVIITLYLFEVYGLSKFPNEIVNVLLCLNVYAYAMLPLTYLVSCFVEFPTSGFGYMFFANLALGKYNLVYIYFRALMDSHTKYSGMMAPQIVGALEGADKKDTADFMDSIFQVFPMYATITAFRKLNKIGFHEWMCLTLCSSLEKIMPNITECTMEVMCNIQPKECCDNDKALNWEEPGILRYIVVILLVGTLLWIIFLIEEYKCCYKYFSRRKEPPPLVEESMDEDVVNEMKNVQRIAKTKRDLGDNVLMADRLTKYFKKYLAVNQISFTVTKGDCFGLLGVNGAGKTTTFKMLIGDENISYGDAYIRQLSVRNDITKAHQHVGYCPQFDALFNELTGRETLKLFCIMRGLRQNTTVQNIDVLSKLLGFAKHLDNKVGNYSGGNKRKLSTAIALLGDTSIVFVDEPTTGVDAAAKRQVWSAIQEAQKAGRGVVLTSHSMEECEALCTRLAIMVNGQFKCIGTPQHLKNKFSEGCTLTIKMTMDEDSSVNAQNMEVLKSFVSSNFKNNKIIEEYQGLIKFYLTDLEYSWAKLFGIMENNKSELKIEDYVISQTSLEQVFLQFTKYQGERHGNK